MKDTELVIGLSMKCLVGVLLGVSIATLISITTRNFWRVVNLFHTKIRSLNIHRVECCCHKRPPYNFIFPYIYIVADMRKTAINLKKSSKKMHFFLKKEKIPSIDGIQIWSKMDIAPSPYILLSRMESIGILNWSIAFLQLHP